MSPILLLVAVAAFVSCSSAKELVVSEELVTKVNILNVGWQAKVYPRFEKMSFEQAEMMLGSNGGWPKNNPPPMHRVQPANDIPTNFDSREQWPGSIHAIRNQGACGSCWAFGASETLSDRFAIASQNKINVVLSAQQLVDCNTKNSGCKGGWPIKAWDYMRDVGLLTEQCYGPYYAKQYGCRLTTNTTECPYEPGYPARFYKAKNAYSLPAKNVEAVQTEIMTYGPVEADFTVYQDFFAYRSGIYMHATGKAVGGHAIKIIGWGTENNEDYWICANSWGSTWGINGYFKIRRGSDECGIEDGITAGQALV